MVCSSLRNFLMPKNFGLCEAQIETPPPDKSGVVGQRFAWEKSGRPRFLAKIPKVFHKLFSKCWGWVASLDKGEEND